MTDLGEFTTEQIAEMDWAEGDVACCELCHEPEREYGEVRDCANCGLMQCRRCWGPTVCDDLYVEWCNTCVGEG